MVRGLAQGDGDLVDDGALAGARWAGDADLVGPTGMRDELRKDARHLGAIALDEGDDTRQGEVVATQGADDEVLCAGGQERLRGWLWLAAIIP